MQSKLRISVARTCMCSGSRLQAVCGWASARSQGCGVSWLSFSCSLGELLIGMSSSKWCTASLVKTVHVLCALPGPNINESLWENTYKMKQIRILWAFVHKETVLPYVPNSASAILSKSDENLVYLHAALYTHNKNCHGITHIHSSSEGKLQETPKVSSSRITYLSSFQIQNLGEIRAAFLGKEEWCL